MNNKIINFTRLRYYMFALSIIVILGGVIGIIANNGFNLGIDFQAGLSQRVQVAPAGLSLTYTGPNDVTLNVEGGVITVEVRDANGIQNNKYAIADYPAVQDLGTALGKIAGVNASVMNGAAATSALTTGLGLPYTLSSEATILNFANENRDNFVAIDEVRSALASLGSSQVQIVGDDYLQEFQVRIQTESEGQKDVLENEVTTLLENSFGAENIVVKQSDYVGPKFSAMLTSSSILLVVIALALILVYIWIRFQLGFAISALTALFHDVLVMLGFIAVFRLEVSTTTIAAVLTIIGYSLNDTIVVFDRIRENTALMKGTKYDKVINTSITQSLSRTLFTSLTTLLAVLPLYIFATGSIKLFALNLIVGVVVGTYSSIFIASPVLLSLVNQANKKKAIHLGKVPTVVEAVAETAEAVEEVKEVEIPTIERKLKGKRQTKK